MADQNDLILSTKLILPNSQQYRRQQARGSRRDSIIFLSFFLS